VNLHHVSEELLMTEWFSENPFVCCISLAAFRFKSSSLLQY